MTTASLTPEQREKTDEYVEKWLQIALETAPADRPRAEAGVQRAYAAAGLAAPRISWCSSPIALELSPALSGEIDRSPLFPAVIHRLRDLVGSSVADSIWASAYTSRSASIGNAVGHEVERVARMKSERSFFRCGLGLPEMFAIKSQFKALYGQIWWPVEVLQGRILDCIPKELKIGRRRRACGDQHALGFLAACEFLRNEVGLTRETEMVLGLTEIAQSAGCFVPYDDICWISERPYAIHRDNLGRLHSENGPAIAYWDGCSVYAVHGVCVPG